MHLSSDPDLATHGDNSLPNTHLVNSAVSWAAIFAGATAAAALSLILLILGTGLGMSSVSPWAQEGVSATTFGVSTIIWITFMSLAASGVGGYLAGRLRTRWVGTHADEVYFRDTAHGLLAWAIATLVTAAMLTSVMGTIIGGGVKAGTSMTGGLASAATQMTSATAGLESNNEEGAVSYFVDSLFRGANDDAGSDRMSGSTIETGRIFMNSIWRDDDLPSEDQRYLAQVVAEHTGLSQQEAQARVADTYTRLQTRLTELEEEAKAAADAAREASAYASLWFFISLLSGAFVSALAATWGGRQRDS